MAQSQPLRPTQLLSFLLPCLLLSGCAMSPGKGFSLFPQGHRLTPAAKALLDQQLEPVGLPRELDKTVQPTYTVEPGDVLLVQPVDLESPVRLPADQTVMPDGTISLGRYGQLVVMGKTIQQIEADVRTAVEAKTKDPGFITVRVLSRASKVFYVLGEVNAPGAFPLQGRETVLDGILAGGGLTDRASRRDIILVRPTRPDGCRIVLPICYRNIVQLGDTSTNYQLAPGDRIYVATSSFWEDLHHGNKDCPPCTKPACACSPEEIVAVLGRPMVP